MLQPFSSSRTVPNTQKHQHRLPTPAKPRIAGPLDVTSKPQATETQIRTWIDAQSILAQDRDDRRNVGRRILRIQDRMMLKRYADIYLNDCLGMSTLPPIIYAPRNLLMRSNFSLTDFARIAYIEGDLNLSDCRALRNLGEQLHVGGSLKLDGCLALSKLPEYLRVERDLDLSKTAITHLPRNMLVRGSLFLNDCKSLRELPPGLTIHGELQLDGCSALETLPGDLWISGPLNIKNCSALQTISNEVHFSKNLFANHCFSLRYIPARISYQKVHLEDCESMRHLNSQLQVSDELRVVGCQNLKKIPRASIQTRQVFADKTAYEANLARNKYSSLLDEENVTSTSHALNRQFNSMSLTVTKRQDSGPLAKDFTGIRDALEFWKDSLRAYQYGLNVKAKKLTEQLLYALWHLSAHDETLVVDFLRSLAKDPMYEDSISRPYLAIRVLFVLGAMQNDFNVRQAILSGLKEQQGKNSNESLSEFEALIQLATMRQRKNIRNDLMKLSSMYLGFAVSEHLLRSHFKDMQQVEKQQFDFTSFNRSLLLHQTRILRRFDKSFSVLSLLPRNDLEQFTNRTLSNKISRLLETHTLNVEPKKLAYVWNHWHLIQYTKRYDRLRNYLVKFEQTPMMPIPQDLEVSQCGLTKRPLAKLRTPVYTQQEGIGKKVYEGARLLEYWLKHGTDPSGVRLDLEQIHRLPQRASIFSNPALLSAVDMYDELNLKSISPRWLKKKELLRWVNNTPKSANLERYDRKRLEEQLSQFIDQQHQTVVIPNTIAIENLAHLTVLPEGLHVDGDLHLNGLKSLRELPTTLSATGNIYINGCARLTSLPDTLEPKGTLELRNCFRLESLPKNLTLAGNLVISRCHSLKQLPEKLTVTGNIYLEECSSLQSFHDKFLSIPGKLQISRCNNLKFLPDRTIVGAGLFIKDCGSLARICHDLTVTGDCRIVDCKGLKELPQQLSVTHSLDLTNASALTMLTTSDSKFKVGKDLLLIECSGLTTLPDSLELSGYLDLSSCTALRQLPQKLLVGKTVRCHNCSSLSYIPNGFTARNNVTFLNCFNLTTLPKHFTIGGILTVKRSAVIPAESRTPLILNKEQRVGKLITDAGTTH